MTPAEYKNGGIKLSVNYSFRESPFGNLMVASTQIGVCHMAFIEDEANALSDLQQKFPNATLEYKLDSMQQNALLIFQTDWSKLPSIKLHLKGTDFQLKVWKTLLKIPMGQLSTYSLIAKKIENPMASRAVGVAIGSNPVAFLIPCHRVIQSSGKISGYRWGKARKASIIEWEQTKMDTSFRKCG